MLIKTRIIPAHREVFYIDGTDHSTGYEYIGESNETIEYAKGPRHCLGHCLWKPCHHTVLNKLDGLWGIGVWTYRNYSPAREYIGFCRSVPKAPSIPEGSWDASVIDQIIDQINLNCRESIMCYSGVLQAIPLVGGALRFNSIMRKAAAKLSKSLRRKPFTTAVKQLIQADFIDRFVVGPMIQDARMFLDAHNYVIRVMNTAYERNAAPVALQAQQVKTISKQTGSVSRAWGGYYGDRGRAIGSGVREDTVTSKAFARVDLSYDTHALSPIKLWATRCGVTRPLDSVWDLVPFSFVIDYFTRAGDFISGLSDQMSSQDGLKGKITQIHDLWGSCKIASTWTYKGTELRDANPRLTPVFQPSRETVTSYDYRRFQIPDPGTFLNSLENSNPLLQDSISLTKLRTIAELIIQAKL
jgi:hypothetical protein